MRSATNSAPNLGTSGTGHSLRLNWSGAHVRALALVPPEHQRAGDVNARIGAGYNPDQEREREIVDLTAAKDEERQRRQKHGAGSDDGPAQGLIQRLVHHLLEGAADPQ